MTCRSDPKLLILQKAKCSCICCSGSLPRNLLLGLSSSILPFRNGEVVLVADTNQQKADSEIMADIYPEAAGVVGSTPRTTCCYPIYLHDFDRIIAAGFRSQEASMKTVFPFGIGDNHLPPDWAIVNMHDPVIAEFSLGGGLSFKRSQRSAAARGIWQTWLAGCLLFLSFMHLQG